MRNGERIILRALESADVDFIYQAENDIELWKYSDTIAPLSKELIFDYAKNYDGNVWRSGQLRLMIDYIENSGVKRVGMVDLFDISARHRHANVGIYITPAYRKQKIATEALSLLHKYASSVLGIHTLMVQIPVSNEASMKLFQKSGYSLAGIVPQWLDTCGVVEDVAIMYHLLN